MKITKDKNNLIIKVPLKAKRYDLYSDKFLGNRDNICGLIVKDKGNIEKGFAYLIDMGFKGKDDQVSDFFLKYYDYDFESLCKELKIKIIIISL